MRQPLAGFFLLGLLEVLTADLLGQASAGSAVPSGGYRATVHQIKEPGAGIPEKNGNSRGRQNSWLSSCGKRKGNGRCAFPGATQGAKL